MVIWTRTARRGRRDICQDLMTDPDLPDFQLYGSELLVFNAAGEVIEARRFEPVVPMPGAVGGLQGP